MKWWDNQLRNLVLINDLYQADEPFHLYLKRQFKSLRAGSKDRRAIRSYSYNFLRIGHLFRDINTEQKLVLSSIILNQKWADDLLYHVVNHPEFQPFLKLQSSNPQERLIAVCKELQLDFLNIFPAYQAVSKDIAVSELVLRHLYPKVVFIWVQLNAIQSVMKQLDLKGLSYSKIEELEDALQLDGDVNLKDKLQASFRLVEVQDISSQLALKNIELHNNNVVWDCCAGSGGKSMHLADTYKGIQWLLSDKRESIMPNLERRFSKVNQEFGMACIDLLEKDEDYYIFNKKDGKIKEIKKSSVDVIIADVPCTGSGTWARNPEYLSSFNLESIEKYAKVQLGILNRIAKFCKAKGQIIYMTCSVYSAENESVVNTFLSQNKEFGLSASSYFGENYNGDILYQAILQKS